jgi:hypothetical protein
LPTSFTESTSSVASSGTDSNAPSGNQKSSATTGTTAKNSKTSAKITNVEGNKAGTVQSNSAIKSIEQ